MTDLLKLKGELRLPKAQMAAWLDDRLGETGDRVSAVLDELQAGEQELRLVRSAEKVSFDGLVTDPTAGVFWPKLETCFRLAAPLGAEGSLALEAGDLRCVLAIVAGQVELSEGPPPPRAPDPERRVPGIIAPASSGRSTCRKCRKAIAAGELRFGEELVKQSSPGNPKYVWFHLACAATALPFSFGPVLRESTGVPATERDALLALLPADAGTSKPSVLPAESLKGKRVTIAASAKEGAGIEGEVIWHGRSKFGPGIRVGVKDAAGTVFWVDAEEIVPVP